jgi:glycosyltransferase involved in cell wall biosynthesis
MKQPILSICIPSYNYGNYLASAIESCLSSNYNFELVIVDNCSDDNTPQLKVQYDSDVRVTWYRNSTVLAMCDNWNYTISKAHGKYVKLLLADDMLDKNFFKLFDQAISKYPNKSIYGHLVKVIDQDNNLLKVNKTYTQDGSMIFLESKLAYKMKLQLIARFKETTCNFFLKNDWEKIGGFNYDNHFNNMIDIDFNLRMLKLNGGCLISEYGGYLRRHNQSAGYKANDDACIKELIEVIDNLWNYIGNDLTKMDIIAGKSWLQFKVLELFLSRLPKKPVYSVKFLFRHLYLFCNFKPLIYTIQTSIRRITTGDAQQYVENYKS